MREWPELTAKSFEILVVRELRKVGFAVGDPQVYRRAELAEPERGFMLELVTTLSRPPWRRRALLVCRRQDGPTPVAREVVDDVMARVGSTQAEVAVLFSTADFTRDALGTAQQHGIALFRVIDGRRAFDASQWGPTGHYPAWLPAYLAQLMDLDEAGQVRVRLLEAGHADLVLEQLPRVAPPAGSEGGRGG